MSVIDRYEIQSEIGRGMMGVVHLTRDPRLRRAVAVKTYTLPDGLTPAEQTEFRERFLREAQAAACLSHPAIVTVFDAGEDAVRGVPYIAMEYVEGQSLQQLLEDGGPFDLHTVRPMVEVLADALQTAHDAGIVHRDIKPANILMRESDQAVKIADFGVARVAASSLTQTGTTIGSPAYMSPEQIRSRPLDGRSDLFSLAVTVYELLCGARPFEGDDPAAIVYAIVNEAPMPISGRMRGPAYGLDGFFSRALAKSPGDRFQDGVEFWNAFREASNSEIAPGTVTVRNAESATDATAKQDHDGMRETRGAGSATVSVPSGAAAPWDSMGFGETGDGTTTRPARARFVVPIAAVVLLVGIWGIFGHKRDAFLKLDARNGLDAGQLTLLIDGAEVYRRELAGPTESSGGLLKKVLERNQESFETYIEIAPGKHEIVARIVPENQTQEYSDSVVVDLEPGETRRLKLSAGRKFGSSLSLKID